MLGSLMILARYSLVLPARERQIMSRPAGVFQLLPTLSSQAAK